MSCTNSRSRMQSLITSHLLLLPAVHRVRKQRPDKRKQLNPIIYRVTGKKIAKKKKKKKKEKNSTASPTRLESLLSHHVLHDQIPIHRLRADARFSFQETKGLACVQRKRYPSGQPPFLKHS